MKGVAQSVASGNMGIENLKGRSFIYFEIKVTVMKMKLRRMR